MKIIFSAILLFVFFSAKAQSNTIGSGIALNFNGLTGNYINLGDVFNTLAFPFTIEAWINPSAAPGNRGSIIGSDNDLDNYRGFWFRLTNTLKLDYEIGDGTGSGPSDRRGYVTSESVPLNSWTHVAVVANSATDVSFYFNGRLISKVSSGGGATNTVLLHSSASATIGWSENMHEPFPFQGQIDEVRLWNITKTVTELRDHMCKKLTGLEPGLIGNWRGDESYISSTVNDYTIPSENGTIVGVVSKLTSGAPIGDVSIYSYLDDYTGISLNLNSPGGDKLKLTKIGNIPHGVHLYRVDSDPYFVSGLYENPNYYFGVFTADDALASKYTITYSYSFSNGVVNEINEIDAELYKRTDGSINTWSNLSAMLNTTVDKLNKKNISTRNEYIFNVKNPNGTKTNLVQKNTSDDIQLVIYPNPASETITILNVNPLLPLIIADINGNIVLEYANKNQQETFNIDVSQWVKGVYFMYQMELNKNNSKKFLIQ